MNAYLTMIMWLMTFMMQKVISMKCAECDYLPHTTISGFRTCSENCFGDICFIVVNNNHNETLTSGCVNVDNETLTFFRDRAYCYKKTQYTICGCTTLDRCNSPQAPLSMFTFISKPFFEDCEFIPEPENSGCNSLQYNITLEKNNPETKEDTGNISIEMREKNISNGSSPASMVNHSINGVESITNKSEHSGDNKNKITGEFIDEVIHNLLPKTNYQHFMRSESNIRKMNKKVKIKCDDNNSSGQYEISRIVFSWVFFVNIFPSIT